MLTAAVCFLAVHAAPSAQDYRKNLQAFVDAERSFSRTSALAGMRESFIQWFADDGLAFAPDPVFQKEVSQKQPVEEKPFKSLLAWEPKIADCSGKGDLGFTTGPFRLIDLGPEKNPIVTGAYFTIWQRQKDGSLKVALELGTTMKTTPAYPTPMRIPGQPKPSFVTADLLDRARDSLARFEDDIAKSTPEELPGTLSQLYDPKPIVYRVDSGALQSSGEAVKWWKDSKPSLKEWKVLGTTLAQSADFAYCYGKYSLAQGGTGYFVHVWKSEYGKGWHIVADVMSVSPSGGG